MKIDLNFVNQKFTNEGCKLLATEYINSKMPMLYVCKCGSKSSITFDSFQRGSRCKKCGNKKSANQRKLTFEFVQKTFEDNGCKLLETEYVNSLMPMSYICKCGNKSKIIFNSFQQGHRCASCAGSEKHTFEFVKKTFEDNGCKLLTNKYVNNKMLMTYICKCGNKSKINFDSFKRGRRCIKCGGKEKHTFEFVKKTFEDNGCTLLETEYVNNQTHMSYICKNGHKSSVIFNHFQQGKRCVTCYLEKCEGWDECEDFAAGINKLNLRISKIVV